MDEWGGRGGYLEHVALADAEGHEVIAGTGVLDVGGTRGHTGRGGGAAVLPVHGQVLADLGSHLEGGGGGGRGEVGEGLRGRVNERGTKCDIPG